MWQEAFGDTVQTSVTPIEQGQYIGLALAGAFQVQSWRSHSGVDPDQQLLWWVSQTAAPIGTSALNFARFRDEVIDGAFATIRANPDPAARQEAAEAINQRFGEMVYNWWYYWTVWAVITTDSVNGVEGMPLPDGEAALPGLRGTHRMNTIWCPDGSCD
jgi:ABC-type transport system substrate-binding protein